MMVNIWLIALVLQLLHGVTGSLVKLNNGGFENIVIGINPQLPEDDKIVSSLKVRLLEHFFPLYNFYICDCLIFLYVSKFILHSAKQGYHMHISGCCWKFPQGFLNV